MQKFVDCRTKDVRAASCTSWRATPRSARSSRAATANFRRSCPCAVRFWNCLKADYDKIFKNDIITDLLKVLGCGVEVRGKAAKDLSAFDLDSLRWHRVIICTDADVDGFQIRTLILTMIYSASSRRSSNRAMSISRSLRSMRSPIATRAISPSTRPKRRLSSKSSRARRSSSSAPRVWARTRRT